MTKNSSYVHFIKMPACYSFVIKKYQGILMHTFKSFLITHSLLLTLFASLGLIFFFITLLTGSSLTLSTFFPDILKAVFLTFFSSILPFFFIEREKRCSKVCIQFLNIYATLIYLFCAFVLLQTASKSSQHWSQSTTNGLEIFLVFSAIFYSLALKEHLLELSTKTFSMLALTVLVCLLSLSGFHLINLATLSWYEFIVLSLAFAWFCLSFLSSIIYSHTHVKNSFLLNFLTHSFNKAFIFMLIMELAYFFVMLERGFKTEMYLLYEAIFYVFFVFFCVLIKTFSCPSCERRTYA